MGKKKRPENENNRAKCTDAWTMCTEPNTGHNIHGICLSCVCVSICTVYGVSCKVSRYSLTHSLTQTCTLNKQVAFELVDFVRFILCALSNMTAGHPSVPISRWGKQGTKIITFAHSHTNIAADIHIGHNILGSHKVRKAINGFGIEPHRKYVPFRTNRVEK